MYVYSVLLYALCAVNSYCTNEEIHSLITALVLFITQRFQCAREEVHGRLQLVRQYQQGPHQRDVVHKSDIYNHPNSSDEKTVTPVVAGEWKPKRQDAGEQIRQVEDITLHPQYDYPHSRYDIALITLAKSITWSDQVSPVCLPEGTALFTGLNATLVGWGYQKKLTFQQKYETEVSEVLMHTKVPVLSNERCQTWLNQKSPLEILIDESSLCAGFEDGRHDGCKGDSGGPLTTRIDGLAVLIGVVSIGLGCGQPKLPGLYSRVAHITPWIQNETK